MSSAGPWSVKGIDPKAREVAKDLARRSGMTLGEWLNQMIIDGEPEPPPPEPEPRRRPVLQAGPQYRPDQRWGYTPEPDADLTRLTRAVDAFAARLEAAEHRSTLAISGIDQSVMGVLSRLDGIEREQTAVGARYEGSLDEVRATQAKLADRMRRMEQEDGPRVEAMKALEAALGRVAAQIYEGESRARGALSEVRQDLSGVARRIDRLEAAPAAETGAEVIEAVVSRISERLEQAEGRTAAAVRALESSFAGLDQRLQTAETRLAPDTEADSPERRFERLAAELSERVETSRLELAEHMRAAADGKLDRMESALRDLSGHVEAAERQSAQAIDRMGREVMRIAQGLGQRVSSVESRSAQAVEQVGGEMARIADAMETRMRTVDTAQAAALEKLGGEIGRIAERLAERIAASERRAATAIDEVGDQVARVTDKINQRHDRTATELSDRIRQSEERTAKLLDEARETLDRRVAETQRPAVIEPAAPALAAAPPPGPAATFEAPAPVVDDFDDGDFTPESFAPESYAPAGFHDEDDGDDPFPEDPFTRPEAFDPPPEPDLHEPAPHQAEGFEAAYSVAAPEPAPEPPSFEDEASPPPARSSTRDLIEAARAAARQAAAADGRGRRARPATSELFTPSAPAPALEGEAPRRGLGLFSIGKKKKKESGTVLRTLFLASVTAAALSSTFVGYNLLVAGKAQDSAAKPPPEAAPAPVAAQTDNETSAADLLAAALAPPAVDAPAEAPAKVEVASAPSALAKPAVKPATAAAKAPPAPATPAVAAAAPSPAFDQPSQLYATAVRQIESGDTAGLEPLRRAANLGYAAAQFYLAKLHETGASGVKKDAGEARRWTERAAAGGDAKAMHNLGLYYFEGTGGAKNTTQAATWFRKAAEAGLQDSQYNLARLFEQGYGVAQNPAEAYKWYLIASSGGDAEAKASAERLRQQLTPEARAAAQRSASAFRPQTTAMAQR